MLSTGVLSPLFGEDTIQGQIALGAECARLIGSSSPELDKLFNMAVSFAKRMHTERRLRVFDESIATAILERLEGRGRVLVVGSGELARMIAAKLLQSHETAMTLRDLSKTFLVPPGVRAVSYDDRMREAVLSDAVVSASSGLGYTFTEENLQQLGSKMVFDLASPPDIPPSASVIRMDDLGVRDERKDDAVSYVSAAADEEVRAFLEWKERSLSISDVSARAESIAFESLRRLSGPIASLSLSPDAEVGFRKAVIDSVRKAAISKMIRKN